VSDGYTLWDEWIEYSPISQPISGLGMGATAWVMNGSFVLLGVLVIVGASAICAELPGLTGPVQRTSAGLLGLVGVGAIIDGVFNLESMLMHAAGFALVISTIVGFPIVGLKLRGIPEWRSLGLGLAIAGPVTLVLAISYFATFDPIAAGDGEGIAGVTQRVLVTWILAWLTTGPMHAYELARRLTDSGKDRSVRFNRGTLYTVVRQPLKAGLIEPWEVVRDTHRPERTVYGLTESGRTELREWLHESVAVP
jgi:hypothetical membrane protein